MMVTYDGSEQVFVPTAKDANHFCKNKIKRAKINLAKAQERNDTRAVSNINRKIALYQYMRDMIINYQKTVAEIDSDTDIYTTAGADTAVVEVSDDNK